MSELKETSSTQKRKADEDLSKKFKFKKVSQMKPFVVFDIVTNSDKLTVDQFVELNQPSVAPCAEKVNSRSNNALDAVKNVGGNNDTEVNVLPRDIKNKSCAKEHKIDKQSNSKQKSRTNRSPSKSIDILSPSKEHRNQKVSLSYEKETHNITKKNGHTSISNLKENENISKVHSSVIETHKSHHASPKKKMDKFNFKKIDNSKSGEAQCVLKLKDKKDFKHCGSKNEVSNASEQFKKFDIVKKCQNKQNGNLNDSIEKPPKDEYILRKYSVSPKTSPTKPVKTFDFFEEPCKEYAEEKEHKEFFQDCLEISPRKPVKKFNFQNKLAKGEEKKLNSTSKDMNKYDISSSSSSTTISKSLTPTKIKSSSSKVKLGNTPRTERNNKLMEELIMSIDRSAEKRKSNKSLGLKKTDKATISLPKKDKYLSLTQSSTSKSEKSHEFNKKLDDLFHSPIDNSSSQDNIKKVDEMLIHNIEWSDADEVDYEDLMNNSVPYQDDFDENEFEELNSYSSPAFGHSSMLQSTSYASQNNSFMSQSTSLSSRADDTKEFQGVYPYTEVMKEVLIEKFGLRNYRPGQEEIINASLAQHDCFVLMPTGGGKSLCYQLPAILTEGVTIVISPLRALIGDQVDKLNSLDIPAAHLCADVNETQKNIIFTKLSTMEPSLKLLYLTPEKIVASPSVCAKIKALYDRKKLARFVIDEVHCMSQWGHDFRPDYKKMSELRIKYPGVPIICLTATATKVVEEDVLSILKLRNVKKFVTSFNRPNIKYVVLPKDNKTINHEIAAVIRKNFPKKSGIIYCLCRKDCEKVAETMCSLGVQARPYHAGMTALQREKQQRDWMNNVFYVVVATIAFGMGIDKPDVRFVIHNSLPKTVEAFYQESGRAGRDGETAYSYLFYNYTDAGRLKKLIQLDRTASKKTLEAHFACVDQMTLYAENKVDCRRQLLLAHLGEEFDRQQCINSRETTCDNCQNKGSCSTKDVTKEAYEIARLVRDLTRNEQLTMTHMIEVYRGGTNKKITDNQHSKHPLYGQGANLSKANIQRVIRSLMIKQFISEYSVRAGHFPIVYIKAGPKLNLESKEKFTLTISNLPERQASSVLEPVVSTSRSSEPTASDINKIQEKCQEELLEVCTKYAFENNVTISSVMNLTAIKYMSKLLPSNEQEFMNIQYVTRANYEKYGKAFLEITKKYKTQIKNFKPKPAAPSFNFAVDPSFNKDDWKTNMPKKSTTKRKGNSYRGRGRGRGAKRKRTYRKKGSPKKGKKA